MIIKKCSTWKNKINCFLSFFSAELVKVLVIAKKLLFASFTNAHLKKTYEELGRQVEKGIDKQEIEWDSPRARALLHTIRACKTDLEQIEKQVYQIKFSSGPKGPEDISLNK